MQFNFQEERDLLQQQLAARRMAGDINNEQYNRYMNRIAKIDQDYTNAAQK